MKKKYKITAESLGFLENIIEAENEDQAWDKMEQMLENGQMTEVDGAIENKRVQEIK